MNDIPKVEIERIKADSTKRLAAKEEAIRVADSLEMLGAIFGEDGSCRMSLTGIGRIVRTLKAAAEAIR